MPVGSVGPAGPRIRRVGGEAPVGAADQLPAALMDRPMMRPAQQGQIGQVGRATIGPVPQMMGVAPGQRPITAWEDTAPVADGQGGPLGWGHDPGGSADLQGLTGRAPQDRGEMGGGGPQSLGHADPVAEVPGRR
jgi:hypothetical protein